VVDRGPLSTGTLSERLQTAVENLRNAQDKLDQAIKDHVDADRLYRVRKAMAFVRTSGTVAQREAETDLTKVGEGKTVADLRYERDLKEGLRQSARDRVHGCQEIIGAERSIATLWRSELDVAKYDQRSA
jgi:hypothetical protein